MMIGALEDEVVQEQACTEVAAHIISIIRTVGARYLKHRSERRCLGGEGYCAAECAIAIGAGTHTTLDLHIAQQGGITVHVGPEDALVLGTVE